MSQEFEVVLLGHTGLLGRHLLRYLNRHFPACRCVGLSSRDLDLTDRGQVARLRTFLTPRTVLIVCSGIKRFVDQSVGAFEKNLSIACNLAQAIAEAPVKKVVYYSTTAVYGETFQNLSIQEETPLNPVTYYGAIKIASEVLLRNICREGGDVPFLVLRPSLIFAPDDEPGFYLPAGFAGQLLRAGRVSLWGDGNEVRDLLYIDDVTHFAARLAMGPVTGTVNLARGESVSYRDVVLRLAEYLGVDPVLELRPRTRERVDHGYDIGRLLAHFPSHCFTPLSESLGAVAAYARGRASSPIGS